MADIKYKTKNVLLKVSIWMFIQQTEIFCAMITYKKNKNS